MIRKLLLSAVIATGTVCGLALLPATADAVPVAPDRDRDRDRDHDWVRFEVLVRYGWHWEVYGRYRDRDEARRVAWRLEREGHAVRIETERGRW